MTYRCRFFFSSLVFFAIAVSAVVANPQASPVREQPDRAITRGELISDLERILLRCENDSDKYATKEDFQSLTQMLRRLNGELDEIGTRTTELEADSGDSEQRLDHLGRPSL